MATTPPVAPAGTVTEQIKPEAAQAAFAVPTPETPTPEALVAAAKSGSTEQLLALMAGLMAQQQRMMDDNAALRATLVKMQSPEDVEDSSLADEAKTYFHSVEGSTVVISRKQADGSVVPETHTFWGGKIVTRDRTLQRFLDGICDKGGSPVRSYDIRGQRPADAEIAAEQVVRSAEKSIDKVVGKS